MLIPTCRCWFLIQFQHLDSFFESVTLGIIDDYSSRLVNDDVSAVIKFGNPIFSVFFHNYFVKYVLSIALITLPVPFIVALMYGVMAL